VARGRVSVELHSVNAAESNPDGWQQRVCHQGANNCGSYARHLCTELRCCKAICFGTARLLGAVLRHALSLLPQTAAAMALFPDMASPRWLRSGEARESGDVGSKRLRRRLDAVARPTASGALRGRRSWTMAQAAGGERPRPPSLRPST